MSTKNKERLIINNKKPKAEIKVNDENSQVESFSYSTESLMPELEELVKKNPNRLIGCGG